MNEISTQPKALEAFTKEAVLEHHIPSGSLGLIVDGVEHHVSLGVTSIAHPLPITKKMLFQNRSGFEADFKTEETR